MTRYAEHVNERRTPQNEKARADQVENNAGGFVFALDKWKRLDRFLVLGCSGGTYYVGERALVKENAAVVHECLSEDAARTVNRIVEISDAGRAPKNDEAIFALAMAAGDTNPKARQLALAALPRVCRIGTHVFHFMNDVRGFRGCGRGLRRAIAAWYTHRSANALAMQAVKYQKRDGWSHGDLLRLSHAKPPTKEHDAVFRWITGGGSEALSKATKYGKAIDTPLPAVLQAFEEVHRATDVKDVVRLIREHDLPHECVPNEWKDRPEVWEAMLDHMGPTALIRNLGKMSAIGLLKPLDETTAKVVAKLVDLEALRAGRVHPMTVLYAMKTYASGHGLKGKLSWSAQHQIVDALDEAFYLSFQAIVPTGKNFLLALDVSGSMEASLANTSLSCREASAAMAMVTARSEKNWHCVGFTASGNGGPGGYGGKWGGPPSGLTPIAISPRQRIDDVVKAIEKLPMGGTDCALPMLYAASEGLAVDAFLIFTDDETWAGAVHPFQALRAYREKSGRAAKLVVVGMTAAGFSVADPNDAGMLDVVGFDSATPSAISEFICG